MKTIVIVGPTGSGKTGAAIEIALACEQKWGKKCEIISADSRAIYRGMDIGTAKPTWAEQEKVRHHGIDLVEPDERFTVVDFKRYALKKIEEIRERGAIPLVVGGTGLYVDALVFDYNFTQEAKQSCADRKSVSTDFIVFGIRWGTEELRSRLEKRVSTIFTQELMAETQALAMRYDWGLQSMRSNIYQFAWRYLQGEIEFEEAQRLASLDDYHLAKRQITWFKRNPEIKWCELAEIKDVVLRYIQDEQKK